MKLELKNIKIVKELSEETICFTAFGYVDGIKTFTVSNRGHGGCHEYAEINCEPDTRARFDEVDAWAKTLPPQKFGDIELSSDLDLMIDDLLGDYELRQTLKRITKGKIAFVEDGKLWTMKQTAPLVLVHDAFAKKRPNAKILNCMDEDSAIELMKATA